LDEEGGKLEQNSRGLRGEIADVCQFGLHPSRRGENAAPQDEVRQFLMVRSAATPRVSNHEARMVQSLRGSWIASLALAMTLLLFEI
jgi:hypothetical protein